MFLKKKCKKCMQPRNARARPRDDRAGRCVRPTARRKARVTQGVQPCSRGNWPDCVHECTVLCISEIHSESVTRFISCIISRNSSVTHFRIDPPKKGVRNGSIASVPLRAPGGDRDHSTRTMPGCCGTCLHRGRCRAAKLHGTPYRASKRPRNL